MTLPDTVTDIGENAFTGCTALKAVVIPSSDIIEHINTNAFEGCTALERIYVGKGDKARFTALLEASGYAVPDENFVIECDFYNLTLDSNLGEELEMPVLAKAYTETLYLPNVGNLPVPTRANYTFEGWYTEKFGGTRINEDDTLSGGDWTLYAHWSTELPGPIFSIDNDYKGVPVLQYIALNHNTEVTLPDGVEAIGGSAKGANGGHVFTNSYDRRIIQRVTMPSSVKRIRGTAFSDCPNLSEVYLSDTLTNIGVSAFSRCDSLKAIDIPGTVDVIESFAFGWCSNLVDLVIGNGVREIGYGAFASCTSLEGNGEAGLVIPDSVKTIGDSAFWKTGIRRLTLPKGVDIAHWAFAQCSNLEYVNIGGEVLMASPKKKLLAKGRLLGATPSNPDAISIGKNAFSGNKKLESVTIDSAVEDIGGGAFSGCPNLTTVTLQNNDNFVIEDGVLLTKDRAALVSVYGSNTSVTVPNSITAIQEFAFANDETLTNAVLQSGVTTIGANAFCDTALATVYVAKGDTARVQALVVGTGYAGTVAYVELQDDEPKPFIAGDGEATVTGDAESGYTVVPSTTTGTVEVEIPSGLDPTKVTVEVPPTASVKPNGANVAVVKIVDATSYDITEFLDIPTAVEGVINLNDATVKDAIIEEVLDPEKGAELELTPDDPSIKTAETRAGLTYTFYEGATLQNMTQKAVKVGDGSAWTPAITVKGGTSGFYSVHVTK